MLVRHGVFRQRGPEVTARDCDLNEYDSIEGCPGRKGMLVRRGVFRQRGPEVTATGL